MKTLFLVKQHLCLSMNYLQQGGWCWLILANWYELQVYFELAENLKWYDTRYKARLIKEMMQDHKNYLCFHFAVPVVHEFEKVNSLFQHTNIDPSF